MLIPYKGRRRRPPPASSLPKERLPVGTLLAASQSALATHSHINVIPRHSDDDTDVEGATDTSDTTARTNPSYLTEADSGLGPYQRISQFETVKQHATFADIARVGLGPQFRPDHMASHEPIALHHYVKFKKPRNRTGAYSPIEEELGGPSAQSMADSQLGAHDVNSEYQRRTCKSIVH